MIEILDENLKKVDILRKYTFAQYNDKFREVGTFKINARIVQENLYLLDKTKEFYVLFDDTVLGKIENVKRESDSEHEQTIVLSGRLGLLLFTKRVIAGTIKFKGNTAQFVKNVIYNEVVKNQSSKRYVNIDIQYDNETYLTSFCSLIDKQVTGGYVWDSVQSVLEQDKLGLYFVPIVETEHIPSWGTEPTNISKWKLTISAGKDRTKGNAQGNVPVVFSQSLSNIARTDYELDTQKYCNVAYVAGEGEEEQRKWYEVYAKEETIRGVEDKAGWQRNELWIDARDIQSTDEEGNEITEAEYEKLIKQRADEKFTDNAVEESYTATLTEANKQYTYGVDYAIGDLVTVIDDELGISIDVQITEVTKSIEGIREIVDIEFTYGKVNRDPVEQVGNIGNNIDKNSNDIKYLENKFTEFKNDFLKQPYMFAITVARSNSPYSTEVNNNPTRIYFPAVLGDTSMGLLKSDGIGVVIGSGVKMVSVSGCFFVQHYSSAGDDSFPYLWFNVTRDRNGVKSNMATCIQNVKWGEYSSICFAEMLVPVKEGDRLDIYSIDKTRFTIRNGSYSYFTVKVVR